MAAVKAEPRSASLDTPATAEYIGVKPHTLECWRSRGEGPPYVRVGRLVRYLIADIDAWLKANTVDTTH